MFSLFPLPTGENSDGRRYSSPISDSRMSTKRKCLQNPSTSTMVSVSNPSASIPPSELPQEIILSILKRLPVKSILRFKCVSKDWLSLLSSPNFIFIHREAISNNPLNHSFIINSVDEYFKDKMYLLNINSTEREPVSFVYPFPVMFREMEFVGSINGLVCLAGFPFGEVIILWNSLMNSYKVIGLDPKIGIGSTALGFAYDSVNDEYKIIRITDLTPKSARLDASYRSRAEVYSASLDSLESVHTDLPFIVYQGGTKAVVKGIPYWCGYTDEANNQQKITKILVNYDVRDGSFKHVSVPKFTRDNGITEQVLEWLGTPHNGISEEVVEWKGNLGMIVSFPSKNADNYFVDIKVYDEIGMCWNKTCHGPIGFKLERTLQCSKDGVILAVSVEGNLILYNPVTNGIKEFCFPRAPGAFLEAVSYTESLVTVKGMEQVRG